MYLIILYQLQPRILLISRFKTWRERILVLFYTPYPSACRGFFLYKKRYTGVEWLIGDCIIPIIVFNLSPHAVTQIRVKCSDFPCKIFASAFYISDFMFRIRIIQLCVINVFIRVRRLIVWSPNDIPPNLDIRSPLIAEYLIFVFLVHYFMILSIWIFIIGLVQQLSVFPTCLRIKQHFCVAYPVCIRLFLGIVVIDALLFFPGCVVYRIFGDIIIYGSRTITEKQVGNGKFGIHSHFGNKRYSRLVGHIQDYRSYFIQLIAIIFDIYLVFDIPHTIFFLAILIFFRQGCARDRVVLFYFLNTQATRILDLIRKYFLTVIIVVLCPFIMSVSEIISLFFTILMKILVGFIKKVTLTSCRICDGSKHSMLHKFRNRLSLTGPVRQILYKNLHRVEYPFIGNCLCTPLQYGIGIGTSQIFSCFKKGHGYQSGISVWSVIAIIISPMVDPHIGSLVCIIKARFIISHLIDFLLSLRSDDFHLVECGCPIVAIIEVNSSQGFPTKFISNDNGRNRFCTYKFDFDIRRFYCMDAINCGYGSHRPVWRHRKMHRAVTDFLQCRIIVYHTRVAMRYYRIGTFLKQGHIRIGIISSLVWKKRLGIFPAYHFVHSDIIKPLD